MIFEFEDKIDSLISLSDTIIYSNSILAKIQANNDYKQVLRSVLNDSTSIYYDFSRLTNLSVIGEPNNLFRIYTWTMVLGNSEYDYFGFTQYQRKRKKGLLGPVKIENYVYELTNNSASIGDNEIAKLDSANWWGCVYYNIVPSPKKKDKSFILLGWDGYSYASTKKIIETIKFSSKGIPSFGHKVIRYDLTHGTKSTPKYQTKARIIFEYSGNVSMTCNYNNNLDMIIFDHLAPSNPSLASVKRVYAPDFTYDGLVYEKKKWIYKKDIDVRNREEIKAIKWKPKDTKERTIDTMIPIRD